MYFLILEHGGNSEWIMDGFCDDINNNGFCGRGNCTGGHCKDFDGGDCCGVKVKKHFCVNCNICKCKISRLMNTFSYFDPMTDSNIYSFNILSIYLF